MASARPTGVLLPAEALAVARRRRPTLALAHIASEWLAIGVAIALCEAWWSPLLYALCVVWIGARLHALAAMAHDAAHGLILRDRRWNDAVSEALIAWPLLMSLRSYRRIHMRHHRFLNSEDDPDWARNRPDRLAGSRSWSDFLRVMLGLSGEQTRLLKFFGPGSGADATAVGEAAAALRTRRRFPVRALFYATLFGLSLAFGFFDRLVLYWLVPLFSWFLLSMRITGTAEHFAVEDTAPVNASRTVVASWLERLLIAPKNIHYHVEHHLHPDVPFYNLPGLHRALMEEPGYRTRAHVTPGYLGFFRELLAERGRAEAQSAG